MRAMILAAGYGTRLWPLTIDRAKPALPFMGRPLVGYVAGYLARYGFREIVVNLHHRPESVRDALGGGSSPAPVQAAPSESRRSAGAPIMPPLMAPVQPAWKEQVKADTAPEAEPTETPESSKE